MVCYSCDLSSVCKYRDAIDKALEPLRERYFGTGNIKSKPMMKIEEGINMLCQHKKLKSEEKSPMILPPHTEKDERPF